MAREPHASYVVQHILTHCLSAEGADSARLSAALSELHVSGLSESEIEVIERRVRSYLFDATPRHTCPSPTRRREELDAQSFCM
jgi:hypothetical protein